MWVRFLSLKCFTLEERAVTGFGYGLLATCFVPVNCRSGFLPGGQKAERREEGS